MNHRRERWQSWLARPIHIPEMRFMRARARAFPSFFFLLRICLVVMSLIKLCEALRKQHSFDAISLMPTNLYGPGDNYHPTNSHVLPALIRRFHEAAERGDATVTCWGTGSPLREFLRVDDLGDACVFVLEQWQPGADELQFLNVGTGVDLTIRQLAEAVAAATGYKGEIVWDTSKQDGTPKKQLDVSRLAALGWRARIALDEGLRSTVALFRQQLQENLVRL